MVACQLVIAERGSRTERRTVMGYRGWLWTHGIDYSRTERDVDGTIGKGRSLLRPRLVALRGTALVTRRDRVRDFGAVRGEDASSACGVTAAAIPHMAIVSTPALIIAANLIPRRLMALVPSKYSVRATARGVRPAPRESPSRRACPRPRQESPSPHPSPRRHRRTRAALK
jgi:hypothetical protein